MNRIRLQLIGILILVALLPAIPAAWTAQTLIRQALDPIIETDILEGARAGLTSTRILLQHRIRDFEEVVRSGAPTDTLTAFEIELLGQKERSSLAALAGFSHPFDADSETLQVLIVPQRMTLQGRQTLAARIAGPGGKPVWVVSPLPDDLAERAAILAENIRLLETLKRERGSVIRGLASTFLLVYGAILILVLLFGLLVASRITRPVAALGHGIEKVAAGNLETQIPPVAGGEIGGLLDDFNRMVERLRGQQAELLRLEKLGAWRQMARSLAHEIKNPLTPIQLAAEQLRDSYPGDETRYKTLLEEATRIIEEEVRALRDLVTEFSQFARLPDPEIGPVAIDEILTDIEQLYGGDTVVCRTAEGLRDHTAPPLPCDRSQIHRVLINLVANALHAQQASGNSDPVEIHVTGGDPMFVPPLGLGGRPVIRVDAIEFHPIQIKVLDRGPGVPEEDVRRIFEPDYTTKSEGMGLGLAIVEAILEGHGGTVTASARTGGGAVFTLTFPIEQAETGGGRV